MSNTLTFGKGSESITIGGREIGAGQPVYVIGEIGLNHNGDIDIAKKLISVAVAAGCDAVKFQKRTPEICVPEDQKSIPRETPWGRMTYLDYRYRVEFGENEYREIDRFCKDQGIHWFASCWDKPSVDFIEKFNPVCYKIASACLTDDDLLKHHIATARPLIVSTGMSTLDQIDHAIKLIDRDKLLLMHTTSTYPCPPKELNLSVIPALRAKYKVPVGYSGHETGLATTVASVALGACAIERHITLDRAMWGSDQAASVEPVGLMKLVRDIRTIEIALGDGNKVVYDSELPILKKLRKHAA